MALVYAYDGTGYRVPHNPHHWVIDNLYSARRLPFELFELLHLPSQIQLVILDGHALRDVTRDPIIQFGQSQLRAIVSSKARTQIRFGEDHPGVCSTHTFCHTGAAGPLAFSLTSPYRFAFQRFYLYHTAHCKIGPSYFNRDGSCSIPYACDMHYTFYDQFDFEWWNIIGWPSQVIRRIPTISNTTMKVFASWPGAPVKGVVENTPCCECDAPPVTGIVFV